MEKKTCIITGGNAGIGKAAAIQIAAKGYHVIIGCRNQERGERALEEIKSASKSDDVELVLLDLSSKESISNAASDICSKINHMDVLIHNAADFDITRKKAVQSKDGVETIWATNHIGPVLLTNLFMEKLKASKHARIITIASKGLMVFPRLKVSLEDPEFKNRKFSVGKAYYQSKMAQIMYTYWLAEELKDTNITANCIRVTNVKLDMDRYPNQSKFNKWIYSIKSKSALTPENMARTYTYLATDPSMDSVSGKYFDEKNKHVDSSSYSKDQAEISKVMKLTFDYL